MKAWGDWMGSVGSALVDPGNPTAVAKTLSPNGKLADGGGANPATGYSVVEAASMDEALKFARTCPHLAANGSIEVAELLNMG
jgi:hypothetical protein